MSITSLDNLGNLKISTFGLSKTCSDSLEESTGVAIYSTIPLSVQLVFLGIWRMSDHYILPISKLYIWDERERELFLKMYK